MSNEKSDSCIDFVADMPAGSHFNIFYESMDELVDVLVSFIKAGLENNDFCAWRLFDPLINVDWARRILKNAGIDADAYILSLIHISEPTRLGMISYAVFCLKKKKIK